jgi:hypothetical protein
MTTIIETTSKRARRDAPKALTTRPPLRTRPALDGDDPDPRITPGYDSNRWASHDGRLPHEKQLVSPGEQLTDVFVHQRRLKTAPAAQKRPRTQAGV